MVSLYEKNRSNESVMALMGTIGELFFVLGPQINQGPHFDILMLPPNDVIRPMCELQGNLDRIEW